VLVVADEPEIARAPGATGFAAEHAADDDAARPCWISACRAWMGLR
jgi:hypothetical protein